MKSAAVKRSSGSSRSFTSTTSQGALPGLRVDVTAAPAPAGTAVPADIDFLKEPPVSFGVGGLPFHAFAIHKLPSDSITDSCRTNQVLFPAIWDRKAEC